MNRPETLRELDIACIVDDDSMFTRILSKQMENINFARSVLVFSNGMDVLDYIQSNLASPELLPSVILLDLNMPVLDGWQFLDAFSKCRPAKEIIIYIVSSSIDKADHEKALAYKSVSRFLVKPIGKDDLLEIWADITARAGHV